MSMYNCVFIAGVPEMVPSITVDGVNITGNIITLKISWGEPFNNFDPIVNYTVSCSGDVTCPPNFTTTDNTTRSYTITNLTPMTTYTFSVVATNSIGNGISAVLIFTSPGAGMFIIMYICILSAVKIHDQNIFILYAYTYNLMCNFIAMIHPLNVISF